MLENIFLTIIKMSATASITAVIVILLRQLAGRKLPRTFSYAAWAIVLIRLLVPFSIQSGLSLFNIVESPVTVVDRAIDAAELGDRSTPYGIVDDEGKSKVNNTGINETGFNVNENTHFKNEGNRINTNAGANTHTDEVHPSARTAPISVIAYIWLSVTLALLGLGIYAYIRTTIKLKTAVLSDDDGLVKECSKNLNLNRKTEVCVTDMVDTPVVTGLTRVRIILPASFVQKCDIRDLKHVITHELVHIKRLDYVTKLLAVLALSIHWFNPLIWLCFLLYQKDMEMSCDARVLSAHKNDIRSEYAKSLLNIAAKQNALLHGGLLAFGESNIRSRIKGIMKFKKNRAWLGIVAALLLVAFGCMLLTNGQSDDTGKNKSTVTDEKTLSNLLEHRTRYIGDASNVSNLLDKLPYGKNKEGIELETNSRPYGITINYRLEDIEASSKDTIKNVKPVLQDNALILFSLIENVDTVKFNILPVNVEVQFERSEMQQHFDRELWEYSNDKKSYEEFLLDIYFKIYIFPEKYSMSMSSVPGMRIMVSLNAALYDTTCSKKCSTENGTLLTWERNTGRITDHGKSLNSTLGEPVYWSPIGMEEAVRENAVTISILNTDGDVIAEKRIRIEKEDAHSYGTKPSYDIIPGSYHDFMQDGDMINENMIKENDDANELAEHIVSMEELLDNSNFQYMTEEQIEAILMTLPEIIRDNYHGVGRIENNSSGYILLTCKSGAKRLPEDTICYGFSPADSELEQLVLQDADENEICRFPLGLEVSYFKGDDIFYIAVGDASKNTSRISQIASYQFSGNRDFIEYAKQAKMRGTSLFIPQEGSYISADIWINRSHLLEYISIDESFAAEIESRLGNIAKTHCDFSSGVLKSMGINIVLADRNNYELCIFDDGTKAIHRWSDRNAVLVDSETHDLIADFVMKKTPWEWVELSEIHDIVKAEMRMKLYRDSREEVQIVEDMDSLKELEKLLSNAKLTGCGGCPYTALLLLTREDGETITLHIATDSCDNMILGTTAGYDYGPDPGQTGLGGDVNHQEVLKRIFDQINWER
jgi:beta-lactamase regulating signal transducer with metallopeptidase domain